MIEYMQSLSLSQRKIYILASDYFIDTIRAAYVVPVNISLIEDGIGSNVSTTKGDWNYDYNENGRYELYDFYRLVADGLWNYDAVKGFSNSIYIAPNDTSDVLNPDGKGVYGFAVASNSLSAAGMLYSTSVEIIDREVEMKTDWTYGPDDPLYYQDYTFSYPDSEKDANASKPLEEFAGNLKALFESTGVVCINKDAGTSNTKSTESTETVARYAFANNQVLFGGIVLLGHLEDSAYGGMVAEEGGGFGAVPVPLYRTSYVDVDGAVRVDNYKTSIHNLARVGAIGVKTTKFAQCTAFLNYQSLNSADVLEDYYDMILRTDVVSSPESNEMLNYIRKNIRSDFDKVYEDAIMRHYMKSGDTQMNGEKWHNQILAAKFQMEASAISEEYARLRTKKQISLEALEQSYANLPS